MAAVDNAELRSPHSVVPAQPSDLYTVVSSTSPAPSAHFQNTMFGIGAPRSKLGRNLHICCSIQWKTRWNSGHAIRPPMTIASSSCSCFVPCKDKTCGPWYLVAMLLACAGVQVPCGAAATCTPPSTRPTHVRDLSAPRTADQR
jgi:hypothetical protein